MSVCAKCSHASCRHSRKVKGEKARALAKCSCCAEGKFFKQNAGLTKSREVSWKALDKSLANLGG